jgi:hypothetical protein
VSNVSYPSYWSEAFNAVVGALAKIGDKKSVKPLLGTLKSGWDEVHGSSKATVIDALGIIGDKSAIEPLIEIHTNYLLDPPGREGEIMGYDGYFVECIEEALENLGSGEQLIETLWNEWINYTGGYGRPNDSIIDSLKDSEHACKIIRNSIEDLVDEELIDPLIVAVEIIEHHKISEDLIYILDTTKKNYEYFSEELIEITLKALERLELSIPELKMILKEKKLPTSGTKKHLIQRIREWSHTFEEKEK